MNEREILHVDMNSFYANVELLDKPELVGKPVAVGGDVESRHGIILAKSIEAKRAGVQTAEPIWEARKKCPDLIVLPPCYEKYLYYSKKSHQLYYSYTNQVEPYGMDECWLDVTGCSKLFGNGVNIGHKIRSQMKKRFGLTVSVGVSFNKVFAKLGSDMKKPDALTYIPLDFYQKIVWPLEVEKMIMVGNKTKQKLNRVGIFTIGELAQTDPKYLKKKLGINGIKLWSWANGKDDSMVSDFFMQAPIKSMGHGITCSSDLLNEVEVQSVFQKLTQKVSQRLLDANLMAQGVEIYIRDSTLKSMTVQGLLPYPSYSSLELTEFGMELFRKSFSWEYNVRAVSIRGFRLLPIQETYQIHFLEDIRRHEKRMRMEEAIQTIRKKYGEGSITYANLLGDLKMPDDGRENVILPSSFK